MTRVRCSPRSRAVPQRQHQMKKEGAMFATLTLIALLGQVAIFPTLPLPMASLVVLTIALAMQRG